MKLLFDQNISFRVSKRLSEIYPECKHVSQCGLNDSTDTEIWSYAKKHHYSIVTFDADFYDISIINGHPPKIIWMRTGNTSSKNLVQLLTHHQNLMKEFLLDDHSKNISCLEIV